MTAAHVVRGKGDIQFLLGQKASNGTLDVSEPLDFVCSSSDFLFHETEDVCLAPIGRQLNGYLGAGLHPWPFTWHREGLASPELLSELRWLEDLYMVGCPAGEYDEVNLIPVARRVTTATPLQIDYKGRPAFLVDGHIYGGSSGSPVMLINEGAILLPGGRGQLGGMRTALLGILTHAIHDNVDTEIGVGKCVKATTILDFEPMIAAKFNLQLEEFG